MFYFLPFTSSVWGPYILYSTLFSHTLILYSFLGLRSRVSHTFNSRVRVRVTLRLTVSQPVSLGVEPLLGLMTRFLVLYIDYCGLCSSWGALSDERVGLSFVGSLCRLCRLIIFTLVYNIVYSICTVCTRPLSVQALWSRLCLILLSLCYDDSRSKASLI
jgi:hypothetical protein